MRLAVRTVASFHCAAVSQLMEKTAASGFAPAGAIGGMRCTSWCRAGICHAGSERLPENFEPRSVVEKVMPAKRLFRNFFHSGIPQSAQHAMRMAQGAQAYIVCFTVYGYAYSAGAAAAPRLTFL